MEESEQALRLDSGRVLDALRAALAARDMPAAAELVSVLAVVDPRSAEIILACVNAADPS